MKMKNQNEALVMEEMENNVTPVVEEKASNRRDGGTILHTIVNGDTLESIQKQYGVTYSDIKDLNRASKLTNLTAGEKIRVK